VLILKKGDVIELEVGHTGESVMSSEWSEGMCERTKQKGCFPVESVYVLPAIQRPTSDILVSKLYYTITVLSNYKITNSRTNSVYKYVIHIMLSIQNVFRLMHEFNIK
jgi:hypothetical protein